MVCTRVPHPGQAGPARHQGRQVPATTNAISELAEQLACQGIQRVVVESTSDYWRAWWYLLQARGLVVWLVNARDEYQREGFPRVATSTLAHLIAAGWLSSPLPRLPGWFRASSFATRPGIGWPGPRHSRT